MLSAFIIPFRECLEAGVVVGILLSVLTALNAHSQRRHVWYGVAAGVVCSVAFAWGFARFAGGFGGATEKVYEGALMLFACGLITHMVFWMKGLAKGLRSRMHTQVEGILERNTLLALTGISFAAVVREGVETVIFFQALDVSLAAPQSLLAAVLGVVAAVLLSYAIYVGSTWLSEKAVFQLSGVLLLFIAGGLLAHGIVEFQGANVMPTIIKPLFDVSHILSEKEGIGAILKAVFGYDANPSLLAVIAYFVFVPVAIWQYTRTRV